MNTKNYFIDCGTLSVSSSQEGRTAEKLIPGLCVEAMDTGGINSFMMPEKNTKKETQAKDPRNNNIKKHKKNLKKKEKRALLKKTKLVEKALKKKTVALKKSHIEKDLNRNKHQNKPYPAVEEVLPPQFVPCDDQLSRSQGLQQEVKIMQNDSSTYGKKDFVPEEVKSLDQITSYQSCKAESSIYIPQDGISDSLHAIIPAKPTVQYVSLNKDMSSSKFRNPSRKKGTNKIMRDIPKAKSILKCKTKSKKLKPKPKRNKTSLKKSQKPVIKQKPALTLRKKPPIRNVRAKKDPPKRSWLARWIWPSNTHLHTS